MMDSIIPLGVDPIELAHPSRQMAVRGLDQKMIMIVHQAVRMTEPVRAAHDGGEDGEKGLPIGSRCINPLPSIATTRYVVDTSWIFKSQRPRHGRKDYHSKTDKSRPDPQPSCWAYVTIKLTHPK